MYLQEIKIVFDYPELQAKMETDLCNNYDIITMEHSTDKEDCWTIFNVGGFDFVELGGIINQYSL